MFSKETIYRSTILFLVLLSGGVSVAAWHNKSVSADLRYELTQLRRHSFSTHAINADCVSNLLRVEADRTALQLEVGSLQREASMAAHTAKFEELLDAEPEVLTYAKTYDEDEALKYYTAPQLLEVLEAAEDNNLAPQLFPILLSIGRAENGGSGKEFGILNDRADTYRKQAGWCAATIQKNFVRWQHRTDSDDRNFIEFLGSRYCPVGAANDPTNLNKNWIKNVTILVDKYSA